MRTQGLMLDQAPPLDVPLRFFLTAPLFGMAAGLLLLLDGPLLLLTPLYPGTIALTHLVTLGWLSMVMLGALYQIIPVLVGATVPAVRLGRYAHAALSAGVTALVLGLYFYQRPLLMGAIALLAVGFALVLGQLGLALWRAPQGRVTVLAIRLGVGSLLAAVTLGLVFAGEHSWGWLPLERTALLGVHVYLGLAGWIGAMLCGVTFAVLPMFYLAPAPPPGRVRLIVGCIAAALLTAPLLLLPRSGPGSDTLTLLPLLPALVALFVFCASVARSLRARRRRITDASLRFWTLGLASGALAGLVLAAYHGASLAHQFGYISAPQPTLLLTFGVLYLVGFAGAIVNGMTYRITAFLVWLHRYAKLAGTLKVPLMKDIVPDAPPRRQRAALLVALLLLAAATLHPLAALEPVLARLAGLALLINCGLWWWTLYRALTFRPKLAPLERHGR